MTKYIVILNGGQGRPTFLVSKRDEACLFDTKDEAIKSAEKNLLGKARGYKIFPWDYFEG